MKRLIKRLHIGFLNTCRIWRDEYTYVFRDYGVLLFFFALPFAYPVVYALIYNTELVRDVPMAVVDDCRTPLSRQLVRDMDASPDVKNISYCANMEEAKRLMYKRECFGILYIPHDFSKKVMRGEESPVLMYCDMSMMLNYKSLLIALTDVTLKLGAELQCEALGGDSRKEKQVIMNPIPSSSITLYNPESGYGTFLIPAVLVLILQQSLILGIGMLAGGMYEKRRLRFYYYDRSESENRNIIHLIFGKTLCYYSLYIINAIYVLHIVPWLFRFPQNAPQWDIYIFITPFLLASILLGMTLSVFCKERESSFILFVFTSVPFLFLSGITWPDFVMPDFLKLIAQFIPSTFGIKGFVHMNTMGATINDVKGYYLSLWGLSVLYFFTAFLIYKYRIMRDKSLNDTAVHRSVFEQQP